MHSFPICFFGTEHFERVKGAPRQWSAPFFLQGTSQARHNESAEGMTCS